MQSNSWREASQFVDDTLPGRAGPANRQRGLLPARKCGDFPQNAASARCRPHEAHLPHRRQGARQSSSWPASNLKISRAGRSRRSLRSNAVERAPATQISLTRWDRSKHVIYVYIQGNDIISDKRCRARASFQRASSKARVAQAQDASGR